MAKRGAKKIHRIQMWKKRRVRVGLSCRENKMIKQDNENEKAEEKFCIRVGKEERYQSNHLNSS